MASTSKNRRAVSSASCASRTTSRSVNVGISSHRATMSRKTSSVSGRFEFRIASSYDGNSTISTTCDASERSVPTTACVAVRFPWSSRPIRP